MILIICMAGFNTRFHDAGFDIPKYLLPYKEGTVISKILQELTTDYNFDSILLVANKRDIYFKKQLKDAVRTFSATIEYIGDTLGQGHTAFIGMSMLKNSSSPILIHNGDTVVANRDIMGIDCLLSNHDAYIDVFTGESPAYCYIRATNNQVVSIAEKKEITPWASSGLYGFKSAELYMDRYLKTVSPLHHGEVFVSDILRTMIYGTDSVVIDSAMTDYKFTTVIGTPQEYSEALK